MRFLIGFLAAMFAVLATPATSATYIKYYASGLGSVRVIDTLTNEETIQPAKVYSTLVVDPEHLFGLPCLYDGSGWASECSHSGNTITAQVVRVDRGNPIGWLSLTFSQTLPSWPTTNAGFQTGAMWGVLLCGDNLICWFKGNLDQLRVTVFEQDFAPRLGLTDGFTYSVPEPATWSLMIFGLAVIGLRQRNSKRLSCPCRNNDGVHRLPRQEPSLGGSG